MIPDCAICPVEEVLAVVSRFTTIRPHLRDNQANRNTAISLLAMFLGIFAGFVLVASWLEGDDIARLFAFTMETAGIREDSLLDRRFPSLGEAFFHNSLVLTVIAFLSFVYRSYGAMLALCWI